MLLSSAVTACFFALLVLASCAMGVTGAAQGQTSSAVSPFADADRLLTLGKFSEAISELENMQTQSAPPSGLAHELGVAYYKAGDYAKSVASFQKALEEKPDDSEAMQLLGLSLYLGGKSREAIPYLEKVQSWYPRANVDASYILGVAYIQTKQYPQAREAFARMFGVPGDSAAAYLFCAPKLLRLDFAPIAEEYCQKSVSLQPKLAMAHYLLGEVYLYDS
jgi:tetratricopeptide (TPR) repeat protein